MSNIFAVHGKIDITIENNIIVIESTGPWNKEYFHHLHQELLIASGKVDVSNYAILLIPCGEAIATHESLQYHIDFIRQGNTKAVAINLTQCDTPNSTKNLCCMIYESAELMFEFFNTNEQAKIWLNKQLN